MKISAGFKPCIQCMRLAPTQYRPDSEGTYIVRLSPNNRTRLKVRNKSYLKVSYGEASTLACLIVDKSLNDDDIIRMDQTVRTAIGLDKMMQGSDAKKSYFQDRILPQPIIIEPSNFPGPGLLGRLLKQQYLICIIHHALPTDMEPPIARLKRSSM